MIHDDDEDIYMAEMENTNTHPYPESIYFILYVNYIILYVQYQISDK